MSDFGPALAVADAVLYEGYLLYPYTASARKNRMRWQFGVVMPRAFAELDRSERARLRTEVLFEGPRGASLDVCLRFLHVVARTVERREPDGTYAQVDALEAGGARHLPFDEAAPCDVRATLWPADAVDVVVPVVVSAVREETPVLGDDGTAVGRVVRTRAALAGRLTLSAEPVPGMRDVSRVRLCAENLSALVGDDRPAALRTAFVAAHALLAAHDGRFLSALDPPDGAADITRELDNGDAFPVLVGDADADPHRAPLALASPIILYDFPKTAAKSEGDLFDATEIDEMLLLSVRSLSEAERAEARATDPRARAIVERAEAYGPSDVERLHDGALDPFATREPVARDAFAAAGGVAHDPFAAIDVPGLDCVFVEGTKIVRGSSVRLHPKRRADAWDMFLKDKVATVRAVHHDLEDVAYVAVTVDDDPASDLHDWYGRSFFFYPDEIEPLSGGAP